MRKEVYELEFGLCLPYPWGYVRMRFRPCEERNTGFNGDGGRFVTFALAMNEERFLTSV